jgi:hypothetical protein
LLLFCEQCGNGYKNIYKLPFALYINQENLSLPKDFTAYMSLCFNCLSGNNPYKESLNQ